MRTLCAIFAHPDDESFSAGGTLARYASEGVAISLVTATSGEAGEAGSAPIGTEGLGPWREGELHAAAAVLGIRDVRLLRFPDGDVDAREDDLAATIAGILRETQPQVVIAEDVHGITGHPDHIAVTRAVVRAVGDLGERGPLKLYEHVLPRSMAPPGLHGTPDDYITTTVDVEPWREQMLAALGAHGSQVSGETLQRFAGYPASLLDHYVCVRTRVPILIPEDDLFSGI